MGYTILRRDYDDDKLDSILDFRTDLWKNWILPQKSVEKEILSLWKKAEKYGHKKTSIELRKYGKKVGHFLGVAINTRQPNEKCLYLQSIEIAPKHRKIGPSLILGNAILEWIESVKSQDVITPLVFAKTSSDHGTLMCKKTFGMKPVDKRKLDRIGRGMYYTTDGFDTFISRYNKFKHLVIVKQGKSNSLGK